MPLIRYAIAAMLPLMGCSEPQQDVLAMRIELKALKQELEYLRQQTEDLDPRVRSAEQMALQVIDDRDAPNRLDCLDGSPGIVVTPIATLPTLCEGVQRTQHGYKLRLMIGNPTTAWLTGFRLTLYVGDGASAGRSERRLYVESNAALPPGGWRQVEFELVEPDEDALRTLALRARVSGIALARK